MKRGSIRFAVEPCINLGRIRLTSRVQAFNNRGFSPDRFRVVNPHVAACRFAVAVWLICAGRDDARRSVDCYGTADDFEGSAPRVQLAPTRYTSKKLARLA